MKTSHHRIELAADPAGPFESLDALVDSGATYTLIPRPMLTRLGVAPIDVQTFVIADGSRLERELGEAVVRIDGRTRTTVVVFGDDARRRDTRIVRARHRSDRPAAHSDARPPRRSEAGATP